MNEQQVTERIRAMLLELYGTEFEADAYMQLPQPMLDGKAPGAMIEAGEGDQVIASLQSMLDGVFL